MCTQGICCKKMDYKNIVLSDDKLNIMEKSLSKAIKWLILLISFIMFYIQAQIAVNSLRDPPVVDSTETLNIADVDPPLITFCPLNQFNRIKIEEYGYRYYGNLDYVLHGTSFKNKVYAWGAQYNLTFEELVDEMFMVHKDIFKLELLNRKMNPRYEERFYPGYGYCIDVSNYTITEEIELFVELNSGKTFVTRNNFKNINFQYNIKLNIIHKIYEL